MIFFTPFLALVYRAVVLSHAALLQDVTGLVHYHTLLKKKISSVLFLRFEVIWTVFTKVLFSFVEILVWHYAVSKRGACW